ncbi:MAG: hypothetical protein LBG77_09145 [Dysgonamonadaceae bacterium]|jgi:hypothetical protein|nr:hypothetical protein [Dysgonamonadaceae bacterium]
MHQLHIVTPIWNAADSVKRSIAAIVSSKVVFPFEYTVYNACLAGDKLKKLTELSAQYHFNVVSVNPSGSSPISLLVEMLRQAQQQALLAEVPLLWVSPDVVVNKDTVQELFEYRRFMERAGLISALVHDSKDIIAAPHLYAWKYNRGIVPTHQNVGLSCVLFTPRLLAAIDFGDLPDTEEAFDVRISKRSRRLGFRNYLITTSVVEQMSKYPDYRSGSKNRNLLTSLWKKWMKRRSS